MVRTSIIFAMGCLVLLNCFKVKANEPNLFVDTNRVQKIKNTIQDSGSTHWKAFNILKSRVDAANGDTLNWKIYDKGEFSPGDGNWNYARNHLAREAALTYLLTDSSKYADMAYNILRQIHRNPDPDGRLPEDGYGLARAMVGMGFAIAYNWCYDDWTPAQRDTIRNKINLALDAWPDYYHPNLTDDDKASNWVAVCRSGEMVMLLSVAHDSMRTGRYEKLKADLNTHLQNAYGDKGVTQEGNGYLGYPGPFLFPAIYASAHSTYGDSVLYNEMKQHKFWKLITYTSSFMSYGENTSFPYMTVANNFGVGGNKYNREGLLNLLFNTVKGEPLDYYQYMYDRQEGIRSGKPDIYKFDQERAGINWLLLYYPQNNTPESPQGNLDHGMLDTAKGYGVFRDDWKDTNDIIYTLMADEENFGYAWDQNEATQMTLIANNTVFFSGPRKKWEANAYSTIQIDKVSDNEADDERGKMIKFNEHHQGGYAIVDGFRKYASLGMNHTERHSLINYPENGENKALISVLDELSSDKKHSYNWNLNLGYHNIDDSLHTISGEENGVPYFTIHGNDNALVKGWVLHPKDAVIQEADTNLKIITPDTKSDSIWVVMSVDTNEAPGINIERNGMKSIVGIYDTNLVYQPVKNQLMLGTKDTTAPQKPSNLNINETTDQTVQLTWDMNTEEDFSGYTIYRGTHINFALDTDHLIAKEIHKNEWTDKTVADTTNYYYKITAQDVWGNVSDSAIVDTTTLDDAFAPQILTVDAEYRDTINVKFDETIDDMTASDISNYSVDHRVKVSNATVTGSKSVKLTVTDLSDDKGYTLFVNGVQDTAGNSIAASHRFNYYDYFHIYESFEGCKTGNLTRQGSGKGWDGTWLLNDAEVIDVSNDPLSVNNISGGNKALRVSNQDDGIIRYFDNSIETEYSTVYLSYLFRLEDTVETDSAFAGMYTIASNEEVAFAGYQKSGNNSEIILRKYSDHIDSFDVQPGEANLLVLKIGESGMTLWMNPESESDAPLVTHGNRWQYLPGLGIYTNDTGTHFVIDDIQLGDDFRSVVENRRFSPLKAPSHLALAPDHIKDISLTWNDNTDNEDGFYIYRKKENNAFQLFDSVNANITSYADTSSKERKTYNYAVAAYNDSSISAQSNRVSVDIDQYLPDIPSLSAEFITADSASLNWTDDNNEVSFRIERRINSEDYMVMDTVPNPGYTDPTLEGDSMYIYRVLAFNTFGPSGYSNTDTVQFFPLPVPGQLSLDPEHIKDIRLTWNDHTYNEEGFYIYRKMGNNDYQLFDSVKVNVTSYSDTSIKERKEYRYKVAAYKDSSISAPSNVDSVDIDQYLPDIPTGFSAEFITADSASLNWTDDNNEVSFRIERRINSEDYMVMDTVPNPGYTDPTLAGDSMYIYRVLAFNTFGPSGYSHTDTVRFFPLPAPGQLSLDPEHIKDIRLTWNDHTYNEEGFYIYRKMGNNDYQLFDSVKVNVTSYSDTSIKERKEYRYKVAAYKDSSISAHSSMVSVDIDQYLPATPTGLSAESITSDSASLNWTDNSDNEEGFRIERKIPAEDYMVLDTVQNNKYTDTTLGKDSIYKYRVQAFNMFGASDYSNIDTILFDHNGIPSMIANKCVPVIYPNPAEKMLNIRIGENMECRQQYEIYTISILNTQGNIVYEGTNKNQIPINDLPSDSYIVRIELLNDEQLIAAYNRKLVIKH